MTTEQNRVFHDDDEDDNWQEDCDVCHGTGGNPWDDGVTPCEECDGEGYKWWK